MKPAGNRRAGVQSAPQQDLAAILQGGEEYLDLRGQNIRNPIFRRRLRFEPSAATKPSVSFQESLGAEGSAVLIATSNSSVQSGT